MVAHLSVPALDPQPNTPSTLSKKIVHDLLRKDLGFEGLIFTDALNMKGMSKYYQHFLPVTMCCFFRRTFRRQFR
jgi:beta-glucosidase-like glycosyl hydrolase